ncbi:MAG: hypothetical protein U1F34_00950 [Gammaproteobacteria bacterium]
MRKQIFAVTLGAVAMLASSAAFASTVPINIIDVNTLGDFDTVGNDVSGWVEGGTGSHDAINVRAQNNTIDGSGSQHDRFGNVFASSFAVLGDRTGRISRNEDSAGTFSIAYSFTLPTAITGRNVLAYNLDLSFLYAFDGPAAGNSANRDRFSVSLSGGTNAPGDLSGFPVTFLGSQLGGSSGPINFTNLIAGQSYTLTFLLNENGRSEEHEGEREDDDGDENQLTGTAVGLDRISLAGTANLRDSAPVPLPPALWLLGSALFGMIGKGRRGSA